MNGYRFPKNRDGQDAVHWLGVIEELVVGEHRGGARVGFGDGHVSIVLPSRSYEEGPQPILPSQARVLAAVLVAAADEAEREGGRANVPVCAVCGGTRKVNEGPWYGAPCPSCGPRP